MLHKLYKFVNFGAVTLALVVVSPAHAVERKLLVSSFENIIVIGDIDVTVVTGKPVSAKASGDKRVLDSLKLERTGTTLRIRVRDLLNDDKSKPITEPLRITLTTPAVQNVVLSGNGQISVSAVKQPDAAKIAIAGSGKIAIGNVTVDRLTVDIDGNGQVDIGGGAVRDGRVTVIGAGEFRGAPLAMRKLRIEHDGNARSAATVAEGTEIFNRGAGNIAIGGKGTCFIKLAGRAVINCAKIDGEKKSK